MELDTKAAITKLKCAVNIKKGCMLTAEESKALVEAITTWTETKVVI